MQSSQEGSNREAKRVAEMSSYLKVCAIEGAYRNIWLMLEDKNPENLSYVEFCIQLRKVRDEIWPEAAILNLSPCNKMSFEEVSSQNFFQLLIIEMVVTF